MKRSSFAAMLLCAAAAIPAAAAAASADHESHHAAPAAASGAPLATGEVRKIDLDQKKITIRHGPLEKLGMPPMTMVFQVSDPALLGQVKAGDKVRFDVEKKADGAYTVTRIEPQ